MRAEQKRGRWVGGGGGGELGMAAVRRKMEIEKTDEKKLFLQKCSKNSERKKIFIKISLIE